MSEPTSTRRSVPDRPERIIPEDYHGIVVREGLSNPSVLNAVRVLGQKKAGEWTLLRVGVTPSSVGSTIDQIQRGLRTVDSVPFYAHFYRSDELIVVFPQRVFRISPDPATWRPAVDYGRSVGIGEDELDFRPCRFEDETY